MSMIFLDGFDQFSNINVGSTVVQVLNASGYVAVGPSATSILVETGSQLNTYGLQITQTEGGAPASLTRTVPVSDKIVIGFAFRANARARILTIEGVTSMEWTDRNIIVNGQAGTAVPILNTWYYYELVLDKSTSEIKLYINGRLDLTVTGFSTTKTEYEITWGWKLASGLNVVQRIDDLYILNGEGERLNRELGPIKIDTRFPTEDVVKEWNPSLGDLHWELVSKRPPQADSYIQSNDSGARDMFRSSTPLNLQGSVLAVGLVVRARKTDIDDRAIGLAIQSGGQTREVIDTEMSTEFKYHYAFFDADPAGQEWTETTARDAHFGVVVRP